MGPGREDLRRDPAVMPFFPSPACGGGQGGGSGGLILLTRVRRLSGPLPTLPRKREREPDAGACEFQL
jgi:hypothetical protein